MHIPDGFLSTPVWLSLDAACVPAIGYAARRARRELEETRVPLLGVMGAFVFAAQMINFPVGAGTSGHLVGGALLAIVLGPASAAVVMTAILSLQAFVFQDGGVLALGANVLNMAFAGVLAGYLPYRLWGRQRLAFFAGGALSVLASAVLALAELLLSGVPMPRPVLAVTLGLFAVNALIEGAITAAVLEGIHGLDAGLVRHPEGTPPRVLAGVALVSVLLAAVGVLVASTHPDAIERLAQRLGGPARRLFEGPLADYQARFLASPWLQKTAGGLAGLALICCLCLLIGRLIARARSA
ncbi:MAG: energy-coupling factor ABC transporter permease [Bryobacteraceae bacterium]|jgi:cobalt/nickel transport system permease protein